MNTKETGRRIYELRKILKYTQEEFGKDNIVWYRVTKGTFVKRMI